MISVHLDIYQTAAAGALALVLGYVLVQRSSLLRKYCIPAAIVGGLVAALLTTALYAADAAEFSFDGTLKNVFMMAFFCSVGFMASFRMLRAGGRIVVLLLILVSGLVILQDAVGPLLCSAFGMDPELGLALGSISLVGGHGTAASYGEQMVGMGIANADTVAVAAATFGLAVSGFVGGPLARRRISKGSLSPTEEDVRMEKEDTEKKEIDNNSFLYALILITVCVGAGTLLLPASEAAGVTLPVYLGAMVAALVVRNICDRRDVTLPLKEINTLGWISLTMFIVLALMTVRLWELSDLAGPMVVILLVQLAVVALYSYFVVFNLTGRDYESAALVTATCGFGLGATPNAVANMEALFKEHGVAPVAYFAVPLVGSVFIDLINAGILTVFLNVL